MNKDWSNLAKIVYRRTYSRKDTGILENWKDTVERVIAGNTRKIPVSEQEKDRLRYFMMNRKAIPAGRGLWFSGAPSHEKIGGCALNNCYYFNASDWNNFVIAQDMLMLGGGVGLSVENRFVSKLPKVKKDVVVINKDTNDADYIVPDSREGWCELTRRILEAFFVTGKSFSYSTVCVRGYGQKIKGFGGVASGPIPLIEFVKKLCKILKDREGKHIRPLDAADIICVTGEMVVAGNVRRSAIIVLGDPYDKVYLSAKRWSSGTIPTYRAFANFSVVVDDVEDLHPAFWKTYEDGEPFGIVNRKNIQKYGRMGELKPDTAEGVNPCQPAFATVLTTNGIRTFSQVEEGDFIWSGQKWTPIINKWSTGVKPVFEYRTSSGVFVGTENHRVFQNGERIEVQYADQLDVCKNEQVLSNIEFSPNNVMDGLVLGDGSVHKASNNLVYLHIGENDEDYFSSEITSLIIKHREGLSKTAWEVETSLSHTDLPKTYERIIPDYYLRSSGNVLRSFLRGLFSANGSVVANRVTLKSASKKLIQQTQILLSSIGIQSYITTNKSKNIEFENGIYNCKESYDLNISSDREFFYRSIGFLQKYKMEKLKKTLEKKQNLAKKSFDIIEKTYIGDFEVFDITVEAEEHSYWTGGVLVSNCAEATLESGENCNLQEIALMNISNEEEFIEAARLMHRYGKRVAMEKYHQPSIQSVVHRNMRIGTGITGCLASPFFTPKILDKVYEEIQKENVQYSQELKVPESIRTTVIKPSGTVSKLLDQEGYEGIHPAFSRYIIQRVRFASDDPLIPILRAAKHHMEPVIRFDGTYDNNTIVVDFYVEAPEGKPVADEDWDTWKQLDVVKMAQSHWADQSVSVTVYYKKEDIPALKTWLSENLQYIKTISFLCHSDHGFKQAPKEKIDRETFNKLSNRVKPIDFDQISEGDLESQECASGVCPVR